MSFRKRMYPGAMVLMVGLLPPAASQAQARTSYTASLLSASVITLPTNTMTTDTDPNAALLSDLALSETDPLGALEITSLSHAGSGISSGWLIGGALSAAAGVASLASGGGSSAAGPLRTPATNVGPVYSVEPGASISGNGSGGSISGINIGSSSSSSSVSSAGSGSFGPLSDSGGGGPVGITTFGPGATPEPGSLALLGGMGLTLTAVKLRRRKR